MESDNVVESSKKIVSPLMDRKLTQLEEKAAVLEKDFESILKRTSEIELWAKQYEIKVSPKFILTLNLSHYTYLLFIIIIGLNLTIN